MKRFLLAVLAVFVARSVLDFVIHGVILQSAYAATPALWRPMAEMNMAAMYAVTLTVALAFTAIYALVVDRKSMAAALTYGLLYGIATGVSMGFGTYLTMPVPLRLAVTWCLGSLVESLVAAALLGAILRPAAAASGNQA
ncbi:MAG: hypothetical protein ABSG86_29135 [Thermoguttaceae bacterium]|jgi:hypothetical protein